MRYKVVPEDFIVEELAQLPLSPQGAYSVYRVRKRGLTTLEVQVRLAAMLKRPPSTVHFPALKDKNAVTTQYACVKGRGPQHLAGEDFSAEWVGFLLRPLRPSDLTGNRFTIALRDLSSQDVARIKERLRQMEHYGLPNYFDQQRFGSYAPGQGFIGRLILQRDAEGALRAYLTWPFAGDPPQVRRFKARATKLWGDWARLLELAPRPSNFRSVLTFLKDHPTAFRKALNLLPPRLLSLYLAAYQSFLWNRMAGRYLVARLEKWGLAWARVEIADQELPFYHTLPTDLLESLRGVSIPLFHHRATFADPQVAALAEAVLAEEGLTLQDMKARVLKRAYLSRSTRALLVFPQELSVGEAEDDELFPSRYKLTVHLTLPPGSYATLIMKGLASHAFRFVTQVL